LCYKRDGTHSVTNRQQNPTIAALITYVTKVTGYIAAAAGILKEED
jgi:hypothetical protein